MLANVKLVKQIVNSITDMSCKTYSRRIWQDKNKKDNTLRNVAFRFWDETEAAKVADELRTTLFIGGFTNVVKLTFNGDRDKDYFSRRMDCYYVRVVAAQ